MIIAEALLLLALDDLTGKPDLMVDPLEARLADAVLAELGLLGRIASAGGASPAGAAEGAPVKVLDPAPTGHPELDAALAIVGAGSSTHAQAAARLAPGLRDRLLKGLADRGVLQPGEPRPLGTTRWRTADPAPEAALRDRLRTVLLAGTEPDDRDAALLALGGRWLASRLVPRERVTEAEARAEEIVATFRPVHDAASADGSAALVSAVVLTTIITPLI